MDAKEILARILFEYGRRAATRPEAPEIRSGRKLLASARALATEIGMHAVANAAALELAPRASAVRA
jgi:hypothetical protein